MLPEKTAMIPGKDSNDNGERQQRYQGKRATILGEDSNDTRERQQ